MEIVLFVNLPLHHPLHPQSDDERVIPPNSLAILVVCVLECVLQLFNLLSRRILFLVDAVLKVPAQVLDLFDLLCQITTQTCQGRDHIGLYLT